MNSSQKQEKASGILEKANFWISNVDAKVSFIVSFTGVFLGFIFASDSITKSVQNYLKTISEMSFNDLKMILSLVATILFVISIYFIAKAVYQLMKALKGRIDPELYKQSGLETKSSIFWGTIALKDYATFKNTFDQSEEQQLNDIQSQAYINSLITKEKFENYNDGLRNLQRGIVVFVIFKLLTYFPI
ncbi:MULTISPECIES: hypothetical protein [Bacillus cereus group]|uniref:hypothetical protein n=1 Tax=Bacillus cereus group TaxID=86661 RepID=UPI001C7F731A|nr:MULTISPECIES: hypothetical protein [Bacillus cereus group]MDZ4572131.1 hypothetical protein [Bacillus cereus]GIX59953.1 hypothetical protein BPADB04_49830 [Bacillus paranthracis]